MNARGWERSGRAGGYEVWRAEVDGREIWNVTDGREPSAGQGGYHELSSLLALKGLAASDFEPAAASPLP